MSHEEYLSWQALFQVEGREREHERKVQASRRPRR